MHQFAPSRLALTRRQRRAGGPGPRRDGIELIAQHAPDRDRTSPQGIRPSCWWTGRAWPAQASRWSRVGGRTKPFWGTDETALKQSGR